MEAGLENPQRAYVAITLDLSEMVPPMALMAS